MNKHRLFLFLIIVLAFVSIGVAWVLPAPPRLIQSEEEFRLTFGIANFTNVLAISTALLFLIGLNGFKPEIRAAYYFICVGLVTQSISTITYSVLSYIEPVERNLFADLPITIGAALMLVGAWRIARVLRVRSLFSHPLVLFIYVVAGSGLFWFIPHAAQGDEWAQANHVLEALFYLPAAWLLWKASRIASASYARSFRLLVAAFAGNFIAAMLFIGKSYVVYPEWASVELLGIFFLVDTFIYVGAGYSFATLQQRFMRQQTANSTIDIVIFAASLVSRSQEIDPLLDELRIITAKIPAGRAPSEQQERQLTSLYLRIEEYLTKQETLRSFTSESLRHLIQHKFDRLPRGITEVKD